MLKTLEDSMAKLIIKVFAIYTLLIVYYYYYILHKKLQHVTLIFNIFKWNNTY